jgi:hypothetical protein
MTRPSFRLRRPAALLAVLLASGGLAACGDHPNEHASVVTAANEGLYLSIGELKYQVQSSRQLNPNDVEDKAFLEGVPADQRALKPNEVWFGVFLQVENQGSTAMRPYGDIEIDDTQDEVFKPLTLDPSNPFAYRPNDLIPAKQILPLQDTPAYNSVNRGSMLLFKLTLTALDNRPLELKIVGTTATPEQTGIIELDV